MTEAALAADAPASAEPSLVPVELERVTLPEPISAQPQVEKAAAKPEPKTSVAETLRAASEKVKADPAAKEPAKVEAKPAEKPVAKAEARPVEAKPEAKPREPETGRFAPREGQQQAPEAKPAPAQPDSRFPAPARFNEAAKAEWDAAPLAVRAEINRAMREADEGIAKHKQASDKFERVRSFYEAAESAGLDPQRVIHNYVELDRALKQDFMGGLDKICQRAGVSLRQVAEHVMGQTPDQNAAKQEQTISQLRAEVAQMRQTMDRQQTQTAEQQVMQFAKDHPRLNDNDFAGTVAQLIETGMAPDLPQAYEMADRLKPVATLFDTTAAQTRTAPEAQTLAQPEAPKPAGQKSISGAPSAGAHPGARLPPKTSIRETLRLAAGRAR